MAYTAPEMRTCGPYSIKSEIYSLGIILWELIQTCSRSVHPNHSLNNNCSKSYQEPFQEHGFEYDFQILPQSYVGLRPKPPIGAPWQLVQIYWECVHPISVQRPDTQHILQLLQPLKHIKSDFILFGIVPLCAVLIAL